MVSTGGKKVRAISVQIAAISTEKVALFLFCFRVVCIEFNFLYQTLTLTTLFMADKQRENKEDEEKNATFELKTMRI